MQITTEELLQHAVHFGHKTANWNPKMKKNILGSSKGIHIMDVEKIKQQLENALNFLSKSSFEGSQFLLVGTKFQASHLVEELGKKLNIPYINKKWLPGFLTNFKTIQARIKKLYELEELEKTGDIERYTKKEQSKLMKQKRELLGSLGGVKHLEKLPDIAIIIDVKKENIAVQEAKKLKIKTVALVDTNGDPTLVDYPIPCNDDGLKSLTFMLSKIEEALKNSKKQPKPEAQMPQA